MKQKIHTWSQAFKERSSVYRDVKAHLQEVQDMLETAGVALCLWLAHDTDTDWVMEVGKNGGLSAVELTTLAKLTFQNGYWPNQGLGMAGLHQEQSEICITAFPIGFGNDSLQGALLFFDHPSRVFNNKEQKWVRLLANEFKYLLANVNASVPHFSFSLFEHNPYGVFLLDLNGRLLEANRSSAEMLETSLEELLSQPELRLFKTKEEHDFNRFKFNEAKNKIAVSFDSNFETMKGVSRIVNITYLPVMMNDQVTAVYGIAKDITERMKAEKALRESEYQLKLVLEGANVGWWDWDLETGSAHFDVKWWAMIGYRPGELDTEENFRDYFNRFIVHPDDYHKTATIFEDAVDQNLSNYELEYRLKHKDGHYIHVLSRAFITFKGKRNPVRISGINVDVSDAKRAELSIQKSEDNLRSVFENTEVGFILLDNQMHILSFNQPAKRFALIDYGKELAVGSSIYDYSNEESHTQNQEIYHAVLNGHKWRLNKKIDHADGEARWYDVTFSPVIGKHGEQQGFMIAVEHITDRMKNQMELQKSFDLLAVQNKRLLNFSYIVSHNLRSHTSNIKSLISFMKEAESAEERDEMLGLLQSVSDRLDDTIHNLNEVVSIHNNLNLVLEPLNMHHYIRQAMDVLRGQIIAKEVEIVIQVPRDLTIVYNPAYLESILLNFLSNAIKYAHPSRKPHIELDCVVLENSVQLNISDNGIGIDLKKNGDKLFGLYKTFNNNLDAKGVGLFLTKNQVDFMGGKIEVESEPGIGTTFKIFFDGKG